MGELRLSEPCDRGTRSQRARRNHRKPRTEGDQRDAVQQGLHRQPWRDRGPDRPHLRPPRHPCHREQRRLPRPGGPGRPGGRRWCRLRAPGLRLPLGEPRFRPRRGGRRSGVDRPAAGGDGGDGAQGPRARDRGRRRRARRTARRGRRAARPGQGRRRWRRQGHARRARGVRARGGEGGRGPGGAQRLRRRHPARREVRRARPAHRGAGHGRRARSRHPPLGAGLLDPAPPPEGAGGGARADHQRRPSASW